MTSPLGVVSYTGTICSTGGISSGPVVWCSSKQKSIATSTVEAEFMAASHAVKELTWLRGFLEELGVFSGHRSSLGLTQVPH